MIKAEFRGTIPFMHFVQGQKDCMAGKIHESGRSKHYDRGYNAQYSLEQTQQWLSERSEQNVRPLNHRAT